MTAKTRKRLAGTAGVAVGLASVIAGTRVLLGVSQPAYTVIPLLVIYNVVMGAIALVAGAGLWASHAWAAKLACGIALCHFAVLGLLLLARVMGESVAAESVGAMIFRSAAWTAIALIVGKAEQRPTRHEPASNSARDQL